MMRAQSQRDAVRECVSCQFVNPHQTGKVCPLQNSTPQSGANAGPGFGTRESKESAVAHDAVKT